MQLLEESLAAAGISEDLIGGTAKITVYGGVCACLENVQSLLRLESEQIDVGTRGGTVSIRGKNLRVVRYGQGDLWIRGDVKRVELGEETP